MYIDLLTKIKNAQQAKKESVKTHFSAMDENVAELLLRAGYVAGVQKKGRNPKRVLEIALKYENGAGVIRGIKFVSTPSRSIYIGYRALRPVKQGYGSLVLSTSDGILLDREARKKKIGGVALFEIW